jgi:hypothetical protein
LPGAGTGTVYGANFAGAGHAVSVLSHPPRTEDGARNGLIAHEVLEGSRTGAIASVVPGAAGTLLDLVLVTFAATNWPQHALSSPAAPGPGGGLLREQPRGAAGDQRSGPR